MAGLRQEGRGEAGAPPILARWPHQSSPAPGGLARPVLTLYSPSSSDTFTGRWPSRKTARAQQAGGEELLSLQLCAASVPSCHHLVPREGQCRVPGLRHPPLRRGLLRVSEAQNNITEKSVRVGSTHGRTPSPPTTSHPRSAEHCQGSVPLVPSPANLAPPGGRWPFGPALGPASSV